MTNHFSYLIKEASTAKTVGADRLMLMAKTASRRYLKEDIPLNDSIRKLAQENDLSQSHIERVCEMANMATHQALWPGAREKEKLAFPLANPKAIVLRRRAARGEDSPCPGAKSMASDYMGPPSTAHEGPSLMSLFGADPEKSHHGLHGGSPRQKLIVVIQKKEAQQSDIKNKLYVAGMKYESDKLAAYRAVKQEVLGGTPLFRVQHAANSAGLGKVAADVLPEFKDKLIGETYGRTKTSLEKVAIGPAPDELVSKNLGNMTVVNGAHPLLISLDLLHKRDDEIKQLFTGLTNVNDELKVYRQRLREL